MKMKTKLQKTALSLAIAACVSVSGAAFANETTSAIKGQITGPNGNPAPGTKITILHVPSGSVKTPEAQTLARLVFLMAMYQAIRCTTQQFRTPLISGTCSFEPGHPSAKPNLEITEHCIAF